MRLWCVRVVDVLVIALVLVTGAGLTACTPWPGPATGGFAERYRTNWPALQVLEDRYVSAGRAGGVRFAAGRMDEAHLLLIRAQREFEGGLIEDANLSIAKADTVISAIERDLRPHHRHARN
jgi:hypothetical protein